MLVPRHPASRRGLDDEPAFMVRADLSSGWIYLSGRLDDRSAHLLHDALSALLVGHLTRWHIDVAELTEIDATGLRAIGAAYRRATRHGRRLTVHGASPALQRALTRLRLNRHLLPDAPAAEIGPQPSTSPDAA